MRWRKLPWLILFPAMIVVAATASYLSGQDSPQEAEGMSADPGPVLLAPSTADSSPPPMGELGETSTISVIRRAEDAAAPVHTVEDEPAEDRDSHESDGAETRPSAEADPFETEPAAGDERPAADPEPLPELSPQMAAFRDRIRRTLGQYYRQPVSTSSNTPADIIQFCLAFGCEAQIRHGNSAINGVGCLCWNYPCAGYRLLRAGGDRIVASIGYGFQTRPAQLLAMLGQISVPEDYELRVDGRRGTVADLVEEEKQACRSGTDQSLRLVGLACYVRDDESWRNGLDEDWSLERLLREELDRSVASDDSGVTDHLMGVGYAVERRRMSGLPLGGEYHRAERFLDESYRNARALQNHDGSWHPKFFALQGTSHDTMGSLRATGRILEWLVSCLPDDQLRTDSVLRAVGYVNGSLEGLLPRWNIASASQRDTATIAHALAALMTYDRRVFRPYERAEPPADADQVQGQTGRS